MGQRQAGEGKQGKREWGKGERGKGKQGKGSKGKWGKSKGEGRESIRRVASKDSLFHFINIQTFKIFSKSDSSLY